MGTVAAQRAGGVCDGEEGILCMYLFYLVFIFLARGDCYHYLDIMDILFVD